MLVEREAHPNISEPDTKATKVKRETHPNISEPDTKATKAFRQIKEEFTSLKIWEDPDASPDAQPPSQPGKGLSH